MFEDKYSQLTNIEKDNFKRILSLLLSKTYIVNRMYDKNQKAFKSNTDYRFIDRNIELFKGYLNIAGFRLMKDSIYDVIYIENEFGYNKKRLDKNTTIFLYGLRLKFDEDRESLKLNSDTVVTDADVVKTLMDTCAYQKKPTDVEIRNALSELISFNVIQKIEGPLEKPDTKIVILPSILFVIPNEKITNVSNIISSLNKSKQENADDLDEYEENNEENIGE